MRINKNPAIILALLLAFNQVQAQIPNRSGWWKFDNTSNLQKAEAGYGVDLTLVGTQSVASGPAYGNGAVLLGKGSYYKMQHQIPANGGGSYVNEYSLQYDFKVPANGVWHSFLQTSVSNSNDGDFFINPTGNIGVAAVGYSVYSIIPNEWYRMIISVKNGSHFTCYLDGKPLISGNIQDVDGRFSLESMLLIFADENGEDADIYCSELSIWNQALTFDQAIELGGFGHNAASFLMTRIPYLQGQGPGTMTVCWHDTDLTGTKVKYGIDSTELAFEITGTSEIISDPYRWHTVKLTGLQANTRYFYRVASGDGESGIFSFKTLPDQAYTGKMRFLLFSDTHASDTTMAGKVLRSARAKIAELYGPDIENHVNGIFHSGDIVVSGSTPGQYTKQYFKPLSALSSNIATMVVAGNHEMESPYFYQYLKLDDQSAFPNDPNLNEKIWQTQIGNALFIGLNTNILSYYTTQANWLDIRLTQVDADPDIDFVFLFFHHFPYSELWNVQNTGDLYARNEIMPILKKHTKAQQIQNGHTHGYERGTVHSKSTDADIRTIIGGGSGGPLDPWNPTDIYDFPDIHRTISNYVYQILEIDIANHSFKQTVYSLGTLSSPQISDVVDSWYNVKNQAAPNKPQVLSVDISDSQIIKLNTSAFSGVDSLMSVQFQVIDSTLGVPVVVDSIFHWENVFNVNASGIPVDLNAGINMYQSKVEKSKLSISKEYSCRVRYRDHNLKWSPWSDLTRFTTLGTDLNERIQNGYYLSQNYPNPFHNSTDIIYTLPEQTEVIFRISDANFRQVAEINEGFKNKGTHHFEFRTEKISSGIYFYKMITKNQCVTRKMVKLQSGK